MLQVKIKSIGKQSILDELDYAWIKLHLDTPLQVMSLNFSYGEAEPWGITVFKEDGSIVSLFVDSMQIKYEFVDGIMMSNIQGGDQHV